MTAARWAHHLTGIGHLVSMVPTYSDRRPSAALLDNADVLIALHAQRSAPAIDWWQEHRSDHPLVVALTGTDLYSDMPHDNVAMNNTERATALVVLQQPAVDRLEQINGGWAAKARVIYQSVERPVPPRNPVTSEFRVVVLAHLRPVKDPLLAARASRLLPSSSRIKVHHAGRAYGDIWAERATAEATQNHRYVWHREMSPADAQSLLATAEVLACTSAVEGGANVVSEAIAMGVPVVGTDIDGNRGLLGSWYRGLVPVGEPAALADLLHRLETDADELAALTTSVTELQPLTEPAREREALAALIDELTVFS